MECKICNVVARKIIKKMFSAINNEHNLSLKLSRTHNGTVTIDVDEFTYASVRVPNQRAFYVFYASYVDLLNTLLTLGSELQTVQTKILIADRFGTSIEEMLINLDLMDAQS